MRFVSLYFLLLFFNFYSGSQELNEKLSNSLFKEFKYEEPKPRALVQYKSNSRLNIIKWVSSKTLYFYQNSLSEQIQAECMYEISCSQYTKKMIEKRGLILGVFLGFHQLNNCHPGALKDYPTFKITSEDKILNHSHFE